MEPQDDIVPLDVDKVDPGVGYVYRWVNLVNGKMYIGSHDGSKPHYKASGVAIRKAFVKHGMDNFKREYLYVGPIHRDMEESFLLMVDAMRNPLYYNMMNTSIGVGSGSDNPMFGKSGPLSPSYGRKISEYQRKRLSETHKGKVESAETREKKRQASLGEKNPNFGVPMSEDQKRKISRTRIANGSAKGKNNPNYGKPRSEDVKEKLRAANIGRKASEDTKHLMSQQRLGVPHEIIKCPHCPKEGGKSAMKRYHFDNCKLK